MPEIKFKMTNLELEDAIYQASAIMKNVPPGRMQDEAFKHFTELLEIQRNRAAAFEIFDPLCLDESRLTAPLCASVPSVRERI